MTQAQLEEKVTDYERNSQALEKYWHKAITAKQLQAEMERMAQHTKQPEVLQELFEALGNDAFVIAECLARPVLAECLLVHSANREMEETARVYEQTSRVIGDYSLPSISADSGCTDNTWTATTTANAPAARAGHTAVWTGAEMIIWGGSDSTHLWNTGARYIPSTDSWRVTGIINAPSGRVGHTAVWTGTEMIIWGGDDYSGLLSTGGRYNPSTNTWSPTSTTNAPSARFGHTAVWTGSEMIVWGSYDYATTGGRYSPATNTWIATTTANAPSGRHSFTAVWTGSEMIIWGGSIGDTPMFLNTGRRYDPNTDSWASTSVNNAPAAREVHAAIWTGTEMIIWGGGNGTNLNSGGRYNPSTNSWTAISTTGAPSGRQLPTAVWTGSEMIVWGGFDGTNTKTGGRYNPSADSWKATSTTNAPAGRTGQTAVWSGSEMTVWGGR
jgi:N-acetylneuraminic acid mutarotase